MAAGLDGGEGDLETASADAATLDEPTAELEEPQPEQDGLQAWDSVTEALERIDERLAESQRLIDRQAGIAAKLHAENQTLRDGELRAAQTTLVLGVLRVYDDVGRMALTAEEPAAKRDLGIVAEALADTLARSGIDPMVVGPGDPFEASRHRIVDVEVTFDPDAARTVARVVKDGFAWVDGTVVRVSDVTVFKYAPPPEDESGPGDPGAPVEQSQPAVKGE